MWGSIGLQCLCGKRLKKHLIILSEIAFLRLYDTIRDGIMSNLFV